MRWRQSGFHVVALASVEDEVGGKEYQRNPRGELAEMAGNGNIHSFGEHGIDLARGHPAQGRAVNDERGRLRREQAIHGGEIGKVELFSGEGEKFPPTGNLRRALRQMTANQSACARDPDERGAHDSARLK